MEERNKIIIEIKSTLEAEYTNTHTLFSMFWDMRDRLEKIKVEQKTTKQNSIEIKS